MILVQVNRDLLNVEGFYCWVYDEAMDRLLATEKRMTEEEFDTACDDIVYILSRDVVQVWDYEDGREVNSLAEIDIEELIYEFMPEFECYEEVAPM